MKFPIEILDIISEEEAKQLRVLQETDLFKPFLKKLKSKYFKLFYYLIEEDK